MTEKLSTPLDVRKSDITENYKHIRENIAQCEQSAGVQEGFVELVAVTKTVPVELINHSISLGVRHIGENRVQELFGKFDELDRQQLKISVIGHLQTNKVKRAVEMSHMIQSVDSEHLAREISLRSSQLGKITECLVEINVGMEESKSGADISAVSELVYKISEMDSVKVSGLMIIPPIETDIEKTRGYFNKIHKLFIDIRDKNHDNSNIEMKYLSMGMSSDYTYAILEGANMVRIGSALYGARH